MRIIRYTAECVVKSPEIPLPKTLVQGALGGIFLTHLLHFPLGWLIFKEVGLVDALHLAYEFELDELVGFPRSVWIVIGSGTVELGVERRGSVVFGVLQLAQVVVELVAVWVGHAVGLDLDKDVVQCGVLGEILEKSTEKWPILEGQVLN